MTPRTCSDHYLVHSARWDVLPCLLKGRFGVYAGITAMTLRRTIPVSGEPENARSFLAGARVCLV